MEPSSPFKTFPADALISFHSQERVLFKRLVFEMGMDPYTTMAVIAFWMWLESVDHPSFIQELATNMSDEEIKSIAAEGEECVGAILVSAFKTRIQAARKDVPATTKVPGSPINLRYLHYYRDLAYDGITLILNDICPTIFGDMVALASSGRASHGVERLNHTEVHSFTGERDHINTSDNDQCTIRKESSILGPYNNGRIRRELINHLRSFREEVDQSCIYLNEDADFVPYNEENSTGQSSSAQIPQYTTGTRDTISLYDQVLASESLRTFNRIQEVQRKMASDYLQMMEHPNLMMSPLDLELAMRCLSLSQGETSLAAFRAKNALAPSDDVVIATRSSSSYPQMHRSSVLHPPVQIGPQESYIPQDERTLFITFSCGYPVDEKDLHDFFSRHYGGVEEIRVQEVRPGQVPLYAQAVFYLQSTCLRILGKDGKAKFMIKGRHVWARLYVPKKKRSSKKAGC